MNQKSEKDEKLEAKNTTASVSSIPSQLGNRRTSELVFLVHRFRQVLE
jgi:hypothetical protein